MSSKVTSGASARVEAIWSSSVPYSSSQFSTGMMGATTKPTGYPASASFRRHRQPGSDRRGATFQAARHGGGVDAGAATGTPVVWEVEQAVHRVELADPAQVCAFALRTRTEPADALGQAAG